MGVPGLWEFLDEKNLGEDICVAALAERVYRDKGRRLRLAIDGNLWSFKNKGGKGGRFPEQRTLYFKLCKLMGLGVDAIFVFDGPRKPEFKRNKKVSTALPGEVVVMIDLIRCFGFNSVIGPGEAEAECAWLQSQGLVDYVMTDDVDSLMFGCEKVLKGWKPFTNGSLAAVSARLYSSDKIKRQSGLTKAGMVIVALLSGGDYCTAGIPHCGIKTAIQIAQAGYGELLMDCNFDDACIEQWKQNLLNSLQYNSSGEFKNKHKAIKILPEFPQRSLFNSYLDPIVSKTTDPIVWNRTIDIAGIYSFAAHYAGCRLARFSTHIAPALFTWKLLNDADSITITFRDISDSRRHKSTGEIVEWRISIDPIKLLKDDLSVDWSELESLSSCDDEEEPKSTKGSSVDPKRHWIAEYIANNSQRVGKAILEFQRVKTESKIRPKITKASKDQSTTLDRYLKSSKTKTQCSLIKAANPEKVSIQENLRPRLKPASSPLPAKNQPIDLSSPSSPLSSTLSPLSSPMSNDKTISMNLFGSENKSLFKKHVIKLDSSDTEF